MWILTSKKTGDLFFLLPEKKSYTVGRIGTDLLLKDDTSISRNHARICPYKTYVEVFDTGSKYGCFCNHNIDNNVRMGKDTAVILKNGERIRFGVLNNEWIVSELHIVTMTSSLPIDKREILSTQMEALNGKIVEEWTPNCTHLTMSEITVTVKVLYALVEQIPIVPCNFWTAYLDNIRKGKSPPKPEQYSPKLSETFIDKNLVNFEVNKNRRHLFDGKTFIFMGKRQMMKYSLIVTKSGGTYKELNTGVQRKFLIQKNCIVVQNANSLSQTQNSQTINSIIEYIESHGKRAIPEYEIGLAIILCSLEKHCNPDYKVIAAMLPLNNFTESEDIDTIIAKETEEEKIGKYLQQLEHIEIPETAGLSEIQKSSNSEIIFNTPNQQSTQKEQTNQHLNIQRHIGSFGNDINYSNADSEDIAVVDVKKGMQYAINSTKRKALCLETEQGTAKRIHVEHENKRKQDSSLIVINTKDFLDKSQIPKSQIYEERQQIETIPQLNASRKRGRLAILDDDDNEDDIFNFGSVKKAKSVDIDSDEGEDPYLSVQTTTTETQPFKKKTMNTVQSKLPNPIKITAAGWLSTTFNNLDIKLEDAVAKTESKNEEDTGITAEPDESAADESGFTVCVKSMSLVSKLKDDSATNADSEDNSHISTNNFKKFVKKHNYNPQNKLIKTAPAQIYNSG